MRSASLPFVSVARKASTAILNGKNGGRRQGFKRQAYTWICVTVALVSQEMRYFEDIGFPVTSNIEPLGET